MSSSRRPSGAASEPSPARVELALLGDLMFCGEWEEAARGGRLAAGLRDLAAMLEEADLVFANLETTALGTEAAISKEPRILATPSTIAAALAALPLDVVNLANNHAFDGRLAGFRAVVELLSRAGIGYFGAGSDLTESRRPAVVETNGMKLGFLGYASLDTVPSHVAGPSSYGANPLSEESVLEDIALLRPRVDHVVVSFHWGIEYCHVPSPEQVRIARAAVDAGARVVAGHHAHVVQGIERYGAGVIAYNLGNVATTDLRIGSRLAIRQTRRTRSSMVLHVGLGPDRVEEVRWSPIRSEAGRVRVDDAYAARRISLANRLAGRSRSATSWKLRRLFEDVFLRVAWKLDPKVVRSIRPKHIASFFQNLKAAAQGRGPAP